jgi:hypothetical protein
MEGFNPMEFSALARVQDSGFLYDDIVAPAGAVTVGCA